ncbi:MAG: single-stranded-DNA-specific exonuclease RecJ [Burkholderiaceae bacterium]
MKIAQRRIDRDAHDALVASGIAPFFARLYAARGVSHPRELDRDLSRLLPPSLLLHANRAAVLLADAIARDQRICIVADYDCDGATACAVGLRGLKLLGASHVDYIVPNRFEYGYGLTPEIVALAKSEKEPGLIVTVDNGIASIEGVDAANRLGIAVLVTDHHLPAAHLPEAACIVNPNQPGCGFPSKHLAGVGVMFYVLFALRAELRRREVFEAAHQPRLDGLLDLVALGTVADVVRLDANNRLLVAQGLERIRAGRAQAGIAALFRVSGREARSAGAFDLGFALGPRINAAGRLADMTLGIECLTTDDPVRATEIATQLDAINRERRDIEATMQETALAAIETRSRAFQEQVEGRPDAELRAAIVLFDAGWHQGVVGIVASRMKDSFHRPTIAFAPAADGTLRGSGRSIAGLHLRDALDLVFKREPGLIEKFGGHAMAAGLTIARANLPRFEAAFEKAVCAMLDPALLTRTIETDGPLDEESATIATVRALDAQVWGQGFAAPLFADAFEIQSQRIVKEKHLKLTMRKRGRMFDAIWFNHVVTLPDRAHVVYRIAADSYNGSTRLQLIVEFAE